ncbi:chymotrypsin-1-like [Battus philenor]|uniref:chymotrypsin-1-like n=1 Tax=Battus philenor TaxID=42288 RepID=UPI0035D02838
MALKICLLLAAILVVTLARPPSESVEFTFTDPTGRIVGGKPAEEGSVPYMVAMIIGETARIFMCGGSLISQRHVLTAAHCVVSVYNSGSLLSSLRIVVGTNTWDSEGQLYEISHNFTHQEYNSKTIQNDIGMLVTSSDMKLSDTVKLVPLSYDFVGGNVNCRVAGWGRVLASGKLSSTLLELYVTTVDADECIEDVQKVAAAIGIRPPPVLPEMHLCAFNSKGHGSCYGDSGSSLVEVDSGKQVGLVSWGLPCGLGSPDMFTRISAFEPWIEEKLAKSVDIE